MPGDVTVLQPPISYNGLKPEWEVSGTRMSLVAPTAHTTKAGSPQPRRTAFAALAVAGVAALSVLAAGCGGGSPASGVAHLGSTTGTTGHSSSRDPMAIALKYAACMRRHGATDFPDPKTNGTGKVVLSIPDSPKTTTAQKACRQLLPGGGTPDTREQTKERTFLLRYAACMRKHGISSFPDPDSQGKFPSTAGFDRTSPFFEAAQKACLPAAGGFVNEKRITHH